MRPLEFFRFISCLYKIGRIGGGGIVNTVVIISPLVLKGFISILVKGVVF
jgi:hypothetical protein